jgi:hypothetical protein
MADEERTPEDMQIVRHIADSARDFSSWLSVNRFQSWRIDSHFEDLVRRVEAAVTGGDSFLGDQERRELSRGFNAGFRVLALYEELGLPFVLALRNMENVYGAAVIVDLRSEEALQRLGSAGNLANPDFSRIIEELNAEGNAVERVDIQKASRSFTTLFVDTLRGVARAAMHALVGGSVPSTTINFTVHSGPGNSGYALAAFPQYRYAPTSFGSKLSTPVHGQLRSGHWCFEGTLAGSTAPPIRDQWPHFVGPNNTSTKTTSF